ncbi:hypothetical protein MNBD_DELTA02-505 [hydrothermal vent metagenome]|uniref:DUF1858 domain-containing protein n=1 Tax=hydrothermal vent metagenome TaxID=652676 RepID=A0A3B0VFB2_9ZZZZ
MSESQITQDMSIGEVMDKFPATDKVFMKYFGDGCFTCPGAKTENIAFGCTMHGVAVEDIMADLNEVISQ